MEDITQIVTIVAEEKNLLPFHSSLVEGSKYIFGLAMPNQRTQTFKSSNLAGCDILGSEATTIYYP